MNGRAAPISLAAMLVGTLCQAQTFDRVGRSEVLPPAPRQDWVLVGASLVDAAGDAFLGVVGVAGGGIIGNAFVFSADKRLLFTVESFYTRGNRGERTDTVTIFDSSTLNVAGEVVVPSKRALTAALDGSLALFDDGRFLAVFNLTPGTSLSIVGNERRSAGR